MDEALLSFPDRGSNAANPTAPQEHHFLLPPADPDRKHVGEKEAANLRANGSDLLVQSRARDPTVCRRKAMQLPLQDFTGGCLREAHHKFDRPRSLVMR
jgi:hypothetical protein